MNPFSWFGGPLSESKIKKIAKLAANPYAQPDVRMKEMEKLLADGSPAALSALLGRFAANASGQIADEDEKKWLEDVLVERGEDVLEPLRAYISKEDQLTYALKAYLRAAGDDRAVPVFVEVLEAYGPDDYRKLDAKLQLVLELIEHSDRTEVLDALLPFLADHSDDVCWAVLQMVDDKGAANALSDDQREVAVAKLTHRLFDADTSPRIARRVAELLADREWKVGQGGRELDPSLQDDFFVDKKKYVRRRRVA